MRMRYGMRYRLCHCQCARSYIFIYTHTCMLFTCITPTCYIHTYIYIYIHIHVYIYIYIYICVCLWCDPGAAKAAARGAVVYPLRMGRRGPGHDFADVRKCYLLVHSLSENLFQVCPDLAYVE